LFTTVRITRRAAAKNPASADSLIPQAADFGYAGARQLIRAATEETMP
jgi:hypothetical protein